MKKKGLLLVVALLALSGLMAAMAYSSASVNNQVALSIKNTNDALLAITAGEHLATSYAHKAGARADGAKVLEFNFDLGYKDEQFGLQRDSVYNWNNLFQVKNNSDKRITVTLKDTGTRDNQFIYFHPDVHFGYINYFDLEPGQSTWIHVQIHTAEYSQTAPTKYNFQFVVEAVVKAN